MRRQATRVRMVWIAVAGIVGLHAGAIIFYWRRPHGTLPVAVVLGVAGLIALKHLGLLAGLLGPLFARFRRRTQ
jgi:hypothetical protein